MYELRFRQCRLVQIITRNFPHYQGIRAVSEFHDRRYGLREFRPTIGDIYYNISFPDSLFFHPIRSFQGSRRTVCLRQRLIQRMMVYPQNNSFPSMEALPLEIRLHDRTVPFRGDQALHDVGLGLSGDIHELEGLKNAGELV